MPKNENFLTNMTSEEVKALKNGETFAELLGVFVNNMNLRKEAPVAAQEIAKSHRTLQQGAYGLAVSILLALSQNNTDMRNENAVENARKVCELLGIEDYNDIAFMVA